MTGQRLAYIYAGFVVLFWGTSATAFKIALGHLSFVQLLFLTSLFSTIILLAVILFRGEWQQVVRTTSKQYLWSALLGLLNPFLYYLILFKAYDLLPAQVAQPLNYIWPIVLVLLSVPLLGQRLTMRNLFALLISFSGVVLISSQGTFSVFSKSNPLGVFLALGSSVIWSLFWIYNVRDRTRDETVKLFLNFLFSTIYCLPVVIGTDSLEGISLSGLLASAYIGAFEMGITFVIWLKALSLASNTAKLGNFIYLVPFVALLFIRLVLREPVVWTTVAGLLLIVGGIVYQQVGRKTE